MESETNFYDILNCDKNATYEELRENYQKLVRTHHPDKNCGQGSEKFLEIDKAWKVLRDPKLREEYDANEFSKGVNHVIIYSELKKEDLVFDENSISLYPCRCGCNFEILKEYTLENECLVECSECSNYISIKWNYCNFKCDSNLPSQTNRSEKYSLWS